MKLNHMVCPCCGHDFYVDAAYGTCDGCQTFFYVPFSRTVRRLTAGQPPSGYAGVIVADTDSEYKFFVK